MQPAVRLDPNKLQSATGRERPSPLLWLCKEMIRQSFRDACRVDERGAPTVCACDAVVWIQSHLDWTTDHGPIPPENLRSEFYLSFEWCCAMLGLDANVIRQQGLPKDCCTVYAGKRLRIRAREDHGRNSRRHVAGLPAIHRVWDEAAKRHAAEIDAHRCVDSAPEQAQVLVCQ